MQNRKKALEPQWALIGSILLLDLEASTKPESDKIRSSFVLHYIVKESIRDRVTG